MLEVLFSDSAAESLKCGMNQDPLPGGACSFAVLGDGAGGKLPSRKESERLLRLPLYYGLSEDQVSYISGKVKEFYGH